MTSTFDFLVRRVQVRWWSAGAGTFIYKTMGHYLVPCSLNRKRSFRRKTDALNTKNGEIYIQRKAKEKVLDKLTTTLYFFCCYSIHIVQLFALLYLCLHLQVYGCIIVYHCLGSSINNWWYWKKKRGSSMFVIWIQHLDIWALKRPSSISESWKGMNKEVASMVSFYQIWNYLLVMTLRCAQFRFLHVIFVSDSIRSWQLEVQNFTQYQFTLPGYMLL